MPPMSSPLLPCYMIVFSKHVVISKLSSRAALLKLHKTLQSHMQAQTWHSFSQVSPRSVRSENLPKCRQSPYGDEVKLAHAHCISVLQVQLTAAGCLPSSVQCARHSRRRW